MSRKNNELNLVKIVTNNNSKIVYQALTDDQLERVQDTQSAYQRIGNQDLLFDIEYIDKVQVFPEFEDCDFENLLVDEFDNVGCVCAKFCPKCKEIITDSICLCATWNCDKCNTKLELNYEWEKYPKRNRAI